MDSVFIQDIQASFGAELIVKSPGRINLLGEHTDYNDGFALPAAITQSIYCGIKKSTGKNHFKATALDKNEQFTYALNNDKPFPLGAWQNYVIGVVQEIQKTGKALHAFEIAFTGNIPQGAGLSSSAALENAVVFALNSFFQLGFTKDEMIKISQKAEHHYVGVQCGIMDQLSSMFGAENKLLKIDFLNDDFEAIDSHLQDYELILINSNVSHQLASSEYNKRRSECESALEKIQAKFPKVKSFQDVNSSIYEECEPVLTPTEYKRVQYLDMEKNRVLQCVEFLKKKSVSEIGNLLFEAHQGLKELYDVTCPETDFLVEKATQSNVVLGARQMGGGFGGCTINLIKKGAKDLFYTEILQAEYLNKFDKKLCLIPIKIGDGTKIIWKHETIS